MPRDRFGALRLLACLLVLLRAVPATAGTLEGVTLPNEIKRDGHTLRLNGMALRTYSIFEVSIYVAGLYLEKPTHDPAELLGSHEMKALVFHFVHDVSADSVRQAWAEGFEDNCPKPCGVSPQLIKEFLESSISVKAGDESSLVFSGPTGSHVAAFINGRPLGQFDDAPMAGLIISSFVGTHPPTPRIKQELLGTR